MDHPNPLKRALHKLLFQTYVHEMDGWAKCLTTEDRDTKKTKHHIEQWLAGRWMPDGEDMQKILTTLQEAPESEDITAALDHLWWLMRRPHIEISPHADDIWNTTSPITPTYDTWAAHFLLGDKINALVETLALVDPSHVYEFVDMIEKIVNETHSDLQGPDNPERRKLLDTPISSFELPMWVRPRINSSRLGTIRDLAMHSVDTVRKLQSIDDATAIWLGTTLLIPHDLNFGMTKAELGLWVCGRYKAPPIAR